MRALCFSVLLLSLGCRQGNKDDSDPVDEEVGPPPWALMLDGIDFQGHENRTVYAAVVRDGHVDITGEAQIQGGDFSITWGNFVREGIAYEVAVFVDRNQSTWCEGGIDDSWLVDLAPAEGDLTVEIAASDPTDAKACDAFPTPDGHTVTLGGLEYTHASGKTVTAVLEDDMARRVQTDTDVIDGGGVFSFSWRDIADHGGSFTLSWYVDLDDSTTCDSNDEAFDIAFGPVYKDQIVGGNYNASASDTGLCNRF